MAGDGELERLRRRLERERRIREQAEAIAEDATSRLYEGDRLKSLFVSTVSHELRTPLTPILGFAQGLTEKWDLLDDDARRDMVDRIRQNASTLKLLIDSLLDFSQLERTQLNVALENVALSQEVARLVDQLTAITHRHQLERRLDHPVTVRADRAALARIVSNLVSNAVKYSPEGGRVRVLTEADDEAGVIVVEDQGPGIAPAHREHVFQRFYRGEEHWGLEARGLGIGLALVRAMAEAMGGAVGVDDADGGGARFWVRLPRAEAEERA